MRTNRNGARDDREYENERDDKLVLLEIAREKEREYLESKIAELEVRCALDDVGVTSVSTYMLFIADTIHDYMSAYATSTDQFLEIGGIYDPVKPSTYQGGRMSEVLPEMWDIVYDMSLGILEQDSVAVIGALAWANHVEHCGGNLLQDHGRLAYVAIDAISNNGLESVFGQQSIDELVDLIEG